MKWNYRLITKHAFYLCVIIQLMVIIHLLSQLLDYVQLNIPH